MSNLVFEPPVRAARKARVVLDGPGGSGRTETALRLALGFGETIGVVDTDRSSAALYAPEFDFLHLPMSSFDLFNLIEVVAAAAEQRIGTLVIDSGSPFWSGRGGVMSRVDHLTKHEYKGDNNRAWADVRLVEHDLMDALMAYPGHVIVTLRVRTEHLLVENEGRPAVVKYGLKPEQRDNFDADFLLSGSLDMSHALTITKSRVRTVPVGAVFEEPGDDLGKEIADWLADGEPVPDALDFRDQALDESRSVEELETLFRQVSKAGLRRAAVLDEQGKAVQLGAWIVARRERLLKSSQHAARQQRQRQQQPQGRQTQTPGQGQGQGQPAEPAGGPIGSEYTPDDKAFVAQWAHAIAVGSTTGTPGEDLATIAANLHEEKASGGVSPGDYTHLFRMLEQRRADLGLPYGQPYAGAQQS